ncbi:META domain-containing protein [Zafaria sp. J156]|uniref:META domain-containing protein n=1 Tax=Zafaria sp. J156 TaxID=3116490 RepID=UPI002E795A3C|nr:META domain-containing protein [Zafaria sp. J156]MEE1621530.1 META domain-containing protein [Zafaria sp. J156]
MDAETTLTTFQWGSDERGSPWLRFEADGRAYGSDGCNRLMGRWERADGDAVAVGPMASTMMYCEGVDTWLQAIATVRVLADALEVYDAGSSLIGSLPAQPIPA